MREESIEAASGAGNADRSTIVIFVFSYPERWERAYAVLRPKTPEPMIKIEDGVFGFAILRTRKAIGRCRTRRMYRIPMVFYSLTYLYLYLKATILVHRA